jgi:hypothetical protein
MNISGEDGVGKAVVDTGPSDVTFKMLVEGHAYIDDNGTWTERFDYHPSTPLNPFAGLTGPATSAIAAGRWDGERIITCRRRLAGGDLSHSRRRADCPGRSTTT